jgi:peptidoglycan DL-endopeptidase CwlO
VAEKVLAFARAQIVKPYVFGAAGPGAYDCSGLTMAAFAATGRQIGGHGVNVQYRLAQSKGLLVPYSAAKPGDLLFYGSGDYYHVAIYSGGGNMIEAPMPGRSVREVPVRTDDLAPLVGRFTG